HHILAIRRDVDVVHARAGFNVMHVLQFFGVDHIDAAPALHDADVDEAAVQTNVDIVGPGAERNFLDDLHGGGIDYIQGHLGFTAEIEARAIGRDGGA